MTDTQTRPTIGRGMLGLKKRRRLQVIAITAFALATSTALVGYAMRDGINYFRMPTQVLENPPGPGEVFRLGGLVEKGSLDRSNAPHITFRVTDSTSTVQVTYTGVPPDLFGEGEGVVATGSMKDGTFAASEILARHDESYMPKEVVDGLKEQGVYVAPDSK